MWGAPNFPMEIFLDTKSTPSPASPQSLMPLSRVQTVQEEREAPEPSPVLRYQPDCSALETEEVFGKFSLIQAPPVPLVQF